jgi:hypothetical protein
MILAGLVFGFSIPLMIEALRQKNPEAYFWMMCGIMSFIFLWRA